MINFKPEQLDIINADPNNNILVSAAAGSGKTTVLTERILKIVTGELGDNISLLDILVMTFTRKATAEMKERIKNKIDEKLKSEPKNVKLIRESSLIQNANILTIDAFCMKILEENYTELSDENSLFGNFDPSYRIADAKELNIMYDDVLDDLLERNYDNSKYSMLFDAYIEKGDDNKLKALLKSGLEFLKSVTWPNEYLINNINNFEDVSYKAFNDFIKDEALKIAEIQRRLKEELNEVKEFVDIYNETLESGVNNSGKILTEKAKETISNVFKILNHNYKELASFCDENILDNVNNKDKVSKIIKSYDIQTEIPKYAIYSQLNNIDQGQNAEYKSIYKDCIEKFNEISKFINYTKIDENIIVNKNEKLFLELLLEYYIDVCHMKKKKNIYDISDYANLSLDILYDKVVDSDGNINRVISKKAKEIADKYKLIFVDEYQDTNFIQEKILKALTDDFNKKNVFMVGDIKQSIYKFRNAEPSIFANKYRSYNENKELGKDMTLSINFRSTKEIIYYVNDLFGKAMTLSYGEIDYNSDGRLNIKDDEIDKTIIDETKVEVHLIKKQTDENSDTEPIEEGEANLEEEAEQSPSVNNADIDVKTDEKTDEKVDETVDEKKYSGHEYEADYIAKKIKELVNANKCKYSDIVILLRSTKSKGKIYLDALYRYSIPSYAEQKKGFFERAEIKLMLSILSVINNPLQNIKLAEVLLSNIYRFTNDEIATIKILYTYNLNPTKKDVYYMLHDGIKYVYDKITSNNENLLTKLNEYNIDKDVLFSKIKRYLDEFEYLRFKSRFLSISELINEIYETMDMKNLVLAMNDGKLRAANLNILYTLAKSYEASSYVGLFNFVRYIEKIKELNNDQSQAKIFDEKANVVRVMTLHSSKGLQFNTVFLASCGTHYYYGNESDKYYKFSQDYGVGLEYYNASKRYKVLTPKLKHMLDAEIDSVKQEELRMLYVALTRAEKKLYITGFVSSKSNKSFDENRLNALKGDEKIDIKDCKCYMDVILSNYDDKTKEYCNLYEVSHKIVEEEEYNDDDFEISKIRVVEDDEKDLSKKYEAELKYFDEKEISKNLENNYKYKDLQKIEPKFSVTNLKKLANENKIEEEVYKDEFYEDQSIKDEVKEKKEIVGGTELGNAYHRYLQFFDYEKKDYVCVNEKLDYDAGWISLVKKDKIEKFLDSDLGKSMESASKNKKLYREHKFMKLFSKSEINEYIYGDKNGDMDIKEDVLNEKNVIIQGIIDAFYIEKDSTGNDSIVVVDYKTDSLAKNEINKVEVEKKLIDSYSIQLEIYAKVLEDLTGFKVAKKYIYSFALDKEILL